MDFVTLPSVRGHELKRDIPKLHNPAGTVALRARA